jgi:hypothetical protein
VAKIVSNGGCAGFLTDLGKVSAVRYTCKEYLPKIFKIKNTLKMNQIHLPGAHYKNHFALKLKNREPYWLPVSKIC